MRSVVLCLRKEEGDWSPVGTAFFVTLHITDAAAILYLVTARHVVEASRQYGPLYLRLNLRVTDGAEFLPIKPDAWHCSLDTDVAVVQVGPKIPDSYDVHLA